MKKIPILLVLTLFMSCPNPTSIYIPNPNNHDGSEDIPMSLFLDTPFAGKVGATSNLSDSQSFYTFNSGMETDLMLTITNSNTFQIRIFTSSYFTNQVGLIQETGPGTSPIFTLLTTGTQYYMAVWNNSVDSAQNFNITIGQIPYATNVGTSVSPADIALDTDIMTWTSNVGNGASFYKFNTGAHTSVTLTYQMNVLTSAVYSAGTWIGGDLINWESNSSVHSLYLSSLTQNTDYFLKMVNDTMETAQISFILRVTGN